MKINGTWKELTQNKIVNDLIGKFIIVKSRKDPSKYKIIYKKNQGWISGSKDLYGTYEDALKAAMDENGEVIRKIGILADDQEVRHLTQGELDIIVREESGSGQAFACEVKFNDLVDIKTCGINQSILDEFNKITNDIQQ